MGRWNKHTDTPSVDIVIGEYDDHVVIGQKWTLKLNMKLNEK